MNWFLINTFLLTWSIVALEAVFIRRVIFDDPRPLSNIGKAVLSPGMITWKVAFLTWRTADRLIFEERAENEGEDL